MQNDRRKRAASGLACAVGLACAAGLAALGGCGRLGGEPVYKVDPQEAYRRLLQADVTGFRDARQCGMLIYLTPTEEPNNAVTWDVTSGSETVARFTLRVTPDGEGSRVQIEVPKAPNGREIYDGSQHYAHPALMQPLRPALREFADAAIDKRPYDWRKIPEPINTDGLCGSLRQNFEASGVPYDINDPSGMTHEQAEEIRARGGGLEVERDEVFAGGGS